MLFKNEQAEKDWNTFVDLNKDFYGKGVVDFAVRWAELMEKEIEIGVDVETSAKTNEAKADERGITGFMYNAAVSILSQCWKYGDELSELR